MITGFNTDVEHEGVVYHVQTEDKGLETPVILSLVYVGGAILASKRSPYDDLLVESFDAGALSERLNRQHKLICAAVSAGRIEDLKRLSGNGAASARKSSRKGSKAHKPAAEESAAGSTVEAKPAAESPVETKPQPQVLTTSAEPDAGSSVKVSEVPAPAEAQSTPEAPATSDATARSDEDAATKQEAQPATATAEETKSEFPSWFETTVESYASVLEKVAASEVVLAEAVEAEPALPPPAVTAETAAAEKSRRFPPKDALVQGGVGRPAEEFVEVAAPAARPQPPATDPAPQPEVTEIIPVEVEGELHVSLMEERDYKAGEIVTLRVRVARGPIDAREAVNDAAVTVKVLGTEFRPLILTSKTDRDGVAVVHAWLPRFTGGRAAILVRATHDGFTAELRRPVRHL